MEFNAKKTQKLGTWSALFLVGLIFTANSAFAQGESHRVSAREACGDDYWKWCAPADAPYDCFKKRGFFKKDSILSPECKRAWSKIKSKSDPRVEQEGDVAPAPKSLNAQSKKPASEVAEKASEKASEDMPRKSSPKSEEVDDFSELDFN